MNLVIFHEILPTDRLFAIAKTFYKSNPPIINMISRIFEKIKPGEELKLIIDSAVNTIKRLHKRSGKTTNADITKDSKIFIENCEFLTDLINTFQVIFLTIGFGNEDFNFIDINEILSALVAAYSIANSSLSIPRPESSLHLNRLELDLVIHDSDCSDPLSNNVRNLKRTILSLVNNYLSVNFFDIIQADINFPANKQLIEQLCDFMLNLFEKCSATNGIHKPCSYLIDAPLVIDLELTHQLSLRVSILQISGHPRIEYLQTSLQNLVTYSGNLETSRYLAQHTASIQRPDLSFSHSGHADISITSPDKEPNANSNSDDLERVKEVSLLHDIFPNLGEGFLEALLVYTKDSEAATMMILENNYPPEIDRLDRNISRFSQEPAPQQLQITQNSCPLSPAELPPPPPYDLRLENSIPATKIEQPVERRNIFDNDEFDIFNKPYIPITKSKANYIVPVPKQEIIKLHNMYNDEYDDTYDSSMTIPVNNDLSTAEIDASYYSEPEPLDEVECALVTCYKARPEIFHHSQRKNKARLELLKNTNMSHEQVEGWYVMFLRNESRDLIVEKYDRIGDQDLLESTKWRADKDESSTTIGSPRRGRGRGQSHAFRGRSKKALQIKLNKGMGGPDRL